MRVEVQELKRFRDIHANGPFSGVGGGNTVEDRLGAAVM
jgi:hypothetical protein